MEAFMIAHDQMVKRRKDLLIVILKEKIEEDKLPRDLRVYNRKLNYVCERDFICVVLLLGLRLIDGFLVTLFGSLRNSLHI